VGRQQKLDDFESRVTHPSRILVATV